MSGIYFSVSHGETAESTLKRMSPWKSNSFRVSYFSVIICLVSFVLYVISLFEINR
jgi:hypothetical protein